MNTDSSVELRIKPIFVAAEAGSGVNVYPAFIAAIFFGLPKVGHVFEFGNFALDKVAIKVGVVVVSAYTAVGVIKPTLKQESVIGLVKEKLP